MGKKYWLLTTEHLKDGIAVVVGGGAPVDGDGFEWGVPFFRRRGVVEFDFQERDVLAGLVPGGGFAEVELRLQCGGMAIGNRC